MLDSKVGYMALAAPDLVKNSLPLLGGFGVSVGGRFKIIQQIELQFSPYTALVSHMFHKKAAEYYRTGEVILP